MVSFSALIPTITISVIDLVAKLERAATVDEISATFGIASSKSLADLPGYTYLPLVSCDSRDESKSNIVGWYDNE